MMTADLPDAPQYFPRDAEMNRTGAGPLDDLRRTRELGVAEVEHLAETSFLLDVRDAASYGAGHLRGSVNIGLGGKFASWAGSLIPIGKQIVLIADGVVEVDESVVRLARVGIENVAGFLTAGIYSWDRAGLQLATTPQMPVDELQDRMSEKSRLQLIDVRGPGEYNAGHIPGAVNIPLPRLEDEIGQLAKDSPVAIVCASGYRSSIASSILERHGLGEVYNVVGGTSAWASAGYTLEH